MASAKSLHVKRIVDNITLSDLQSQFDQPIVIAAKHFGVCVSILKRVCRRHGISKWPQRAIRGLKRQIAILEDNVSMIDDPHHRASIEQELRDRRHRLAELYTGDMSNNRNNVVLVNSPFKRVPQVPVVQQTSFKPCNQLPPLRTVLDPHHFLHLPSKMDNNGTAPLHPCGSSTR